MYSSIRMYPRVYGGYPVVSRPRLANYDDVTRAKWKPRSRQNHNRLSLFSSFLSSWIQVRAKLAPSPGFIIFFLLLLAFLGTTLKYFFIPPPLFFFHTSFPLLASIPHLQDQPPALSTSQDLSPDLVTGSPPTSTTSYLCYFYPSSILQPYHLRPPSSSWV